MCDTIKQKFNYVIFLVFMTGNILFSQNSIFTETNSLLENGFPNKALKKLNEIDTLQASNEIKGRVYELMGLIYEKKTEEDKAFDFYIKSKKKYQLAKNKLKENKINLDIFYLLSSDSLLHKKAKKYYDAFFQYALKTQNDSLLAEALMAKSYSMIEKAPKESKKLLFKVVEISERLKNNLLAERAYTNLGVLYNEKLNSPDSAIYYLDKSFQIIQKENKPEDLIYYYTNKAGAYYYKNDIEKAIETLKKGIELPISHIKYHDMFYFLALYYAENKDYDIAYETLVKYDELKNQKNQEEIYKSISDMATKYESQEKELENLKLKTKLQNNSIIMITVFSILIILSGFSYFGYKNIKKKKKIIEQEKLIQDQKLINMLKEQELHDIDLILESQENERKRIANELHDHLGSLMTTIKINFENIKKQNHVSDLDLNIFTKTNDLLDEAYTKIRTISHIKNLGVLANEGLLVAVRNMAQKMSVLNRIQFNVIPFGLNERIYNQLEITLFRIIQELSTNIIKHSDATEVNIYLTQHGKNELNIIIEDNGKGFDPKKIKKNDGIGLKSIEKRIEEMGGIFNIDSRPPNGTTIIIDLPI